MGRLKERLVRWSQLPGLPKMTTAPLKFNPYQNTLLSSYFPIPTGDLRAPTVSTVYFFLFTTSCFLHFLSLSSSCSFSTFSSSSSSAFSSFQHPQCLSVPVISVFIDWLFYPILFVEVMDVWCGTVNRAVSTLFLRQYQQFNVAASFD